MAMVKYMEIGVDAFSEQLEEKAKDYGLSLLVRDEYYGRVACMDIVSEQLSNGDIVAPALPLEYLYERLFKFKYNCDWNAFLENLEDEFYEISMQYNLGVSYLGSVSDKLMDKEYQDKIYPCFVQDTKFVRERYETGTFSDLCYIYCIDIVLKGDGKYCIPITKEALMQSGISSEELSEMAFANLKARKDEFVVYPASKMIYTMMMPYVESSPYSSIEQFAENCKEVLGDDNLCHIGSRSKWFGANCLFVLMPYLKGIADKLGQDKIYIIPSSIHEFMMYCPNQNADERATDMDLRKHLLRAVCGLASYEVVSEKPLVYDRDTDSITFMKY